MTAYKVLIPCRDDKTGKSYRPGDTVTADDFAQAVINAWLKNDPPVLEVIANGS